VVIGDRFETLGFVVSAFYSKIPVCHIQGGEVSGSLDDSARRAISSLSTVHCVGNNTARDRLIGMGIDRESVFVTGCPSQDVMSSAIDLRREDLKLSGQGCPPDFDLPFLLIQIHADTTSNAQLEEIFTTDLISYLLVSRMPFIWIWPNIDAGSNRISKIMRRNLEKLCPLGFFTKNLSPCNFYWLLGKAQLLIGNSSSFVRDSGFFGTTALIVGDRQNKRDSGENCHYASAMPSIDFLEDLMVQPKRIDFKYGDTERSPSTAIFGVIQQIYGKRN